MKIEQIPEPRPWLILLITFLSTSNKSNNTLETTEDKAEVAEDSESDPMINIEQRPTRQSIKGGLSRKIIKNQDHLEQDIKPQKV